MSQQAAAKAQIKTLEGVMAGLMQRLEKLAQHPDQKAHGACPHFVSLHSCLTPAADYDGMLGSFILDQGLSCAFGDMGSGASGFDFQNIADCTSEFFTERAEAKEHKKDTGRGLGTFGLGEHRTICNLFNDEARKTALAAFYVDYAERLDIEEALVWVDRDMSLYYREAPSPAPIYGPTSFTLQ